MVLTVWALASSICCKATCARESTLSSSSAAIEALGYRWRMLASETLVELISRSPFMKAAFMMSDWSPSLPIPPCVQLFPASPGSWASPT